MRTAKATRAGIRRRGAGAALFVAAAGAACAIVLSAHTHNAFDWLRPSAPPASWQEARTADGATIAFPRGWQQPRADPGAVSAQTTDSRGAIVAYLNATPAQGAETLGNWARFRPAHDAEEGERNVRVESSATGLHFRAAHGSCVVESYSTAVSRYREIACIVAGGRATTVVVAAAPPTAWAAEAPVLEAAIRSFSI